MRLILLLCLAGCGSTPHRTDTEPPPIPTLIKDQGKTWIGGLKDHHGWDRHAWVVLARAHTKLAVALVIDGEGQDAVPIHVLAALPNTDLEGAEAEVLKAGHWPRVGKLLGRIVQRETDLRIRIDLGRADGVMVGDRFTVRPNPRDRTELGALLEVTALHETHAEAEIRVPAGPPGPDQPIVFLPAGEQGPRPTPKLHIVVAGFTPQADNEKTTAFAQKYARDFANRLTDATKGWQGVQVSHVPDIIPHDDHTGHDKARELGRKHQAHLVVWGTMMCVADEGCASPRFTVVDPQALRHAELSAGDHTFAPSPLTENKVSEDLVKKPETLAAALLGFLSFRTGDHQQAAYYFGRAIPTLTGDDLFRALRDRSMALVLVDDHDGAALAATLLAEKGGSEWQAVATASLAFVALARGDLDTALTLQLLSLRDVESAGSRRSRAVVLGEMSMTLFQKGEVDDAKLLAGQARRELESMGDRASLASILILLARMEWSQGNIPAALELAQEARTAAEALPDQRLKGVAWALVGQLRLLTGDHEQALTMLEKGVVELDRLASPDDRPDICEATILTDLAYLKLEADKPAEAIPYFRRSIRMMNLLGSPRGEVIGLTGLGMAMAATGDRAGALQHLEKAWGLSQGLEPERVAEAAFLFGVSLLEAGSPAEAQAPLEAAVDALQGLGIPDLLQEAKQALAVAREQAGK
jgi:tetratricopeptide (TPR) repeat protein